MKTTDLVKNKAILISIIIVAFISLTSLSGVIYLIINQNSKKVPTLTTVPVETSALATPSSESVYITPSSLPILQTPTPTPDNSTVVVYETEGSYQSGDKDQIIKKVVNPFLDYYKEQTPPVDLVSLTISLNTGSSKANYPYQARGVFKNSAIQSFLISKTGTNIDWWLPECMQCVFSDVFKSKYPDIISKF